jgi:hypothetical protein
MADFHVLGLFMAKKHDLSEIFSVCHAPGPSPLNAKFVPRLQPSLNIGSRPNLGQLNVLHTQNLEIQVPKGSHLRKVF